MTTERAIEILTPYSGRYSPTEYEEALAMARAALEKEDTNAKHEQDDAVL